MLNALVLIAFSVGNIIKIPLFATAQISILDIVVLLALVTGLFRNQPPNRRYNSYIYAVSGFALLAFVSLILAGQVYGTSAQFVGLLYLMRWFVYASVGLFLPKNISVLWLGLSIVVIGLLQYIFLPDVRFLAQSNWDPHYYRVVGSFLDPGYTGLLIVLFLAWVTTTPIKHQKVIWLLGYITLALTYSRSSYLAFIVLMAIVSFRRRSLKFFVHILMLGVVTIAVLPHPGGEGVKLERSSTIYARLRNWNQSLTIASDHPLLGVGFNTYRYAQHAYGFLSDENWEQNHAGAGADSSLLFVLATTGTLGLTLYCLYLYRLTQLPSLSLYLIPILIHSWFLNSLFYPPVLFFLGILIARSTADRSLSSLSDSDSRPSLSRRL